MFFMKADFLKDKYRQCMTGKKIVRETVRRSKSVCGADEHHVYVRERNDDGAVRVWVRGVLGGTVVGRKVL